MKYYLAKTEPDDYSIDDLERDKIETWNGVRHPAAVKFLKEMNPGDRVLIYHTGDEKSIVGLAEVTGESRPDPNDKRSWLRDFKYIRKYDEPYITLRQIKETGKFADFRLVREPRLSVMEVPYDFISYLKEFGINLN